MFHIFPALFLSRTVAIYQFHLVQHYSFITFKLTKGKDCLIGESAFCNMEGGRRALVSDVDSPWECTCQGTRMSTFFHNKYKIIIKKRRRHLSTVKEVMAELLFLRILYKIKI